MEIYGTLGPACSDENILLKMFGCGMTGMRLNLSHSSLKESEAVTDMFHRAALRAGVKAGLIIDMKGPEQRIGKMDTPVRCRRGGTLSGIPFPAILLPACSEGCGFLINDGKVLVRAKAKNRFEWDESGEYFFPELLVVREGMIEGGKSIAVSLDAGENYSKNRLSPVSPYDEENLKYAKKAGVTGIMQPFVRSGEDLLILRKAMEKYGCQDLRVFAKIENTDGVRNLADIAEYADEIVIARGDLGNSIPLWELPRIQKTISKKCREYKKPFMVVTQMLESMIENPVPTRAEVSDIYNAALDGASSLMVTGETAVGKYPVEVIRYLVKTADEINRINI